MSALRILRPDDDESSEPKPFTVGHGIALWRKYHASKWARGTWLERKRSARNFCLRYGRAQPEQLTHETMEEWIHVNPDWVSDWTIKRNADTIRLIFDWLVRAKRIRFNPFAGFRWRPGEDGRDLSPQEFKALVRSTDAVFRRVLFFLYLSGARPCEMSQLEWTFLDLGRGVMTLRKHKTARSRKDRKPREIMLHEVVVRLLRWMRRRQPPDAKLVFLNSRGEPWTKNSLDLRIYRLRKKIGLPDDAKLYGNRHAFGTQWMLKGGDMATLAQLMGHTSVKTTERYVHLANRADHFRKELGRVMGKSPLGEKDKKE
jgi:integrase/recombinase XerD